MTKNVTILITRLLFGYTLTLFCLSGCTSISATPDATVIDMPSNGIAGKIMKKNSEKFEACARDSVTIQTDTIQHVILHFKITPEGQVVAPQVLRMGIPDPDLRACILHVLKKIQFPPPKDGETKTIEYPLTLKAS